ncbi:hypothetical protein IFT84_19430 [Rhizobium sp. CFBP 8762]|uniref:hypothetical protein n=1 Tax=Rhizobium sp. CFBP 8762 TaxID=2775279 RepID=UPI00177F4943|nr:hypothetical protein [Rhizobium sp. CFBP 8762]MBD8556685.1 hypothetical protein [Rhizobium sp. CFBP 8762]
MSNRNTHSQNIFTRAFAVFSAATTAAAAIEGRRRPTDRDLRTLGIDPNHFNDVGRG